MSPEVSTIIPAFNAAAFIREAIDSALAQQGVDQEIIVVDDGSTDETPRILAEYGDRIHVITQENRGIAASRNRAAAAARGEWLAFLDADDVWMPGKLAKQLAQSDVVDLVFSQRENFGDISRVAQYSALPPATLVSDLFQTLLLGNCVTTSTVLLRRSTFARLGSFEESRELMGCEDWDLWVRFADQGGKLAFLAEPLVRYRWHASGISHRGQRIHRARLLVVERALAAKRAIEQTTQRRARANVWSTSAWYVERSDRWTAASWYLRAACYQPWHVSTYKSAVKCLLGRV